jgi:putative Mg2+ transporter-C (MgtC) family protein
MLIGLGAALFTIVSIELSGDGGSADRVAAQIVTGIGFLGGGAILRSGHNVHGMTTAATIWVNAGVGMAVGARQYSVAAVATIITLVVLAILGPAERYFERRARGEAQRKENGIKG